MRIKLVKDNKLGKKGEVIEVSKNVAFGLIDSGSGIVSKDMTNQDLKESNSGNISVKRSDYRRRR